MRGSSIPKNDKARVASAGQVEEQSESDNFDFASDDDRRKAFTNIRATLALKGYVLHRLADGCLLIERWGYLRAVDGVTQAAQFLAQIGGHHG